MAAPLDPEYQARLQALRDKFGARLPATLERIEQALAACRVDVATGVRELHEQLHGIAGTAGTFGYGMLGQQARLLEQRLRAVTGESPEWPALAAEIEHFLRWAKADPAAQQYVAPF